MNLILFDEADFREALLPFTFTRPISGIRVGILTIAEKWERYMGLRPSHHTSPHLSAKYPLHTEEDNLFVNSALCPDRAVVSAVGSLEDGAALMKGGVCLGLRTTERAMPDLQDMNKVVYEEDCTLIRRSWHIFRENGRQLREDFLLLTQGRNSEPIRDPFTKVYSEENVFLESGASIRAAILDAEQGPIYIGRDAQVQEGAIIKGPFSLGEGSVVNMGAKIRGDTSVGPFSKVGGEVSNSVIFGYSNKGHDGFIGNTVIGEWCNLGADTNTSNLKNNYSEVKLWDYSSKSYQGTGQTFCGLMMGDHSKCGINTMFNTGTVVGVGANIFGGDFPPKFLPSFLWGGKGEPATFRLEKMLEVAEKVMLRRKKSLNEIEKTILAEIFEMTRTHRDWELGQ